MVATPGWRPVALAGFRAQAPAAPAVPATPAPLRGQWRLPYSAPQAAGGYETRPSVTAAARLRCEAPRSQPAARGAVRDDTPDAPRPSRALRRVAPLAAVVARRLRVRRAPRHAVPPGRERSPGRLLRSIRLREPSRAARARRHHSRPPRDRAGLPRRP